MKDNVFLGYMTINGGDFKKLQVTDFNNINVFVGQNGSGKTFLLKSAWFTTYVLQAYKVLKQSSTGDINKEMLTMIDYLIPMTFEDSENMTYDWTIGDKNKTIYSMTVAIEDGKAKSFKVDEKTEFDASEVTVAKYATTNTRLMSDYERYLQTLKLMGGATKIFSSTKDMIEFGKWYKLYDIMMFEQIRRVMDSIEKGDEELMKTVNKTMAHLVEQGEPFKEGDTITVNDGIAYSGGKKIASLGNGHQALIMMYVFYMN